MKISECNDCGAPVFWAHAKRQSGEWKPMMMDANPGGKMQSYSISEVDGKARAEFVPNAVQQPGQNYFAAHYKTCSKGAAPKAQSRPKTEQESVVATFGKTDGTIVVKIGHDEYEGTLTKRVPF